MSKQTIYENPNLKNFGEVTQAIDLNFTELYTSGIANIPIWQLSNIFQGLQRIPSLFKRLNPENPGSPGSMLKRFVVASTPDSHGKFDEFKRFETFINLIKTNDITVGDMVNALVVQGDIITDQETKAEAISLYSELNNIANGYTVDFLPGFGNHDSNSRYSNATDVVLSKAEQRALLIDPTILNVNNIEAGDGNACYYYKDYDNDNHYKVRVIMLDMYDMPQNITGSEYTYPIYYGINYSQAQLTWLAETALSLPSDDWHVIIFGHQRLSEPSVYNTSYLAVQDIIDAYAVQGTVSRSSIVSDFEYTANYNFSVINGFNGNVIGYFYGHGHVPVIGKTTINTRDYNHIEVPSADQQSIGYNRQSNSGVADMMTFIIVDTEDRKIFLLRYGNPCDVDGVGLPYGDLGIDTPITY